MSDLIEFNYTAHNATGTKIKGVIEAPSEGRAYTTLKTQGLIPLKVKPVSSGMNTEINIPGFKKRVKTKDLSVFARQFAALLKAGIPLVRALHIVTMQTESPRLKESLQRVVNSVEGGDTLAGAMSKESEVFPLLMISLVTVGESGGFLDRTLDSVSKNLQSEVELRGKLKAAMTYPVIVGVIAIIAVIGMLIFVVPTFQKMFEDMGAELPAPTQFLVLLSERMPIIAPIGFILLFVFIIWYRKNKAKEFIRMRIDPVKLRLPVFGKLNSKVAIARFSRNLAMMINAGVPLLAALELVAGTADNWVMQTALKDVQEQMRKGKSFGGPIANHPVFPPIVTQMISVGEESGALDSMLDSIADFYEEEVNRTTESLSAAMEPLMILFLGGMVGGMVIALYLPMFSLFEKLSQQS